MRKSWNLFLLLTTLALLTAAVACGPDRSGGNDDDNNGGNTGNNGGTTPGSVWGSGDEDSSGGGGFGFGQGASTGNNGANNEQPGSVETADCQQACEKLGECFGGEVDADDLAACPAACADEALPSEVSCILDAACGDILNDCIAIDPGNDGPPPSQSACEDACDKLIGCFEEIPSSERASCVQGCTQEATSSEIACVNAQSCSGVLSTCFGVDDFDLPDENNTSSNNVSSNNSGPASSAECVQACDKLVGCYGDQIPPAQLEGAKQECQAGCVEEATSAQIECVLDASCATLETECNLGGEEPANNSSTNNFNNFNNSTNNPTVSQDCAIACSYLVTECGEFPDEQSCYDQCASWGAIDGFCFFESSCADWEQCL